MANFVCACACRRPLRMLLPILLCIPGCGPTGPTRIALEGTVTVAGQPIEKGNITVMPAAGKDGVAASTAILNGRYKFTREDGPSAGATQILIMNIVPKGVAPDPKKITAGREPRWQLDFEVPEKSPATKDFQID